MKANRGKARRSGEFVVVVTTLPKAVLARRLARQIVDNRLAACVQTVRIHSTYRWRGRVETASEYRLEAKTRAVQARRLVRFLAARHPYEVPELVVMPLQRVAASYGRWLKDATGASGGEA